MAGPPAVPAAMPGVMGGAFVPKASLRPGRVILAVVVVTCCAVELVLSGADWGLWGSAGWRPRAYQNGGFWAGLLHGWTPNYAAQPALMFPTHAFLHAGPTHLLGNMVTLSVFGPMVSDRLGGRRFAGLYLTSVLGGALAFGLLATSPAPMVGASGAIFGLAGAWTVWDWRDRQAAGLRGWAGASRAMAIAVGLLVLNLVVWIGQDGLLAWQTHLGGFLAGCAFAALSDRRHLPQ